MSSSKVLEKEYEKLTSSGQLLQLRLKRKNVEELLKPTKRRSTRLTSTRKIKKANDAIVIAGLRGTLGSNLVELADRLPMNDAKKRYFALLSRNGIIDMSDSTALAPLDERRRMEK